MTKKQSKVSRSSAEAEYRALAYTTENIRHILFLLQELAILVRWLPNLHCDNISATYLASNHVLHTQMKHIEIEYHFLCERVMYGSPQIVFVISEAQIVDIFIISQPILRFKSLRTK